MIFGVTAKIGHGKGCLSTKIAIGLCDKGRDVYSNYPIFDKRVKLITRWAEVSELGECDVFIDEAHSWFPAREASDKLKIQDMTTWAQSRHDGINLYWISQKPGLVDKQIREVYTHEIYRIQRLFGPADNGKPSKWEQYLRCWAWVTRYDAENYHLVTKRRKTQSFPFNLEDYWGKYDTDYIIGDRFGNGCRAGRSAQADARAAVMTRQRWLELRETAPLVAPGQWGRSVDDTIADSIRKRDNDRKTDNSPDLGKLHGIGSGGRPAGGDENAVNGSLLGRGNKPRFWTLPVENVSGA